MIQLKKEKKIFFTISHLIHLGYLLLFFLGGGGLWNLPAISVWFFIW